MKAARPVSVLTEPGGKGREEQSETLTDAQLEMELGEKDLDIVMLSRRGSENSCSRKDGRPVIFIGTHIQKTEYISSVILL